MKDMTVKNSPGVVTRTFGFGETTSFETVDSSGLVKYIKPLADHLESIGYKRGKDIRGAPYDFRYSPGKRLITVFYLYIYFFNINILPVYCKPMNDI